MAAFICLRLLIHFWLFFKKLAEAGIMSESRIDCMIAERWVGKHDQRCVKIFLLSCDNFAEISEYGRLAGGG